MTPNFAVTSPFDGRVVGDAPNLSDAAVLRALDEAKAPRPRLGGAERAAILNGTAEIIARRAAEISALITAESGLSLKSTGKEVLRAVNCFRQAAAQAEIIDSYDPTPELSGKSLEGQPRLTVITEPWDLVVGITPFNHPLNAVAHKIAPAVAAGTPMVLKPSEQTPLTALLLRDILVQAGLPASMFQVVTGIPAERLGRILVTDSRVDMVTFTGSADVGRRIVRDMANGGNELKQYVGELGGNACYVVMDDADLDLAARVGIAAFENSGQRCTAIRKILVHSKVAQSFVERFAALAAELRWGDPGDPSTDVGTVINERQAMLIERRVNDALARGARLVCGNRRQGALYSPTIVDKVAPADELAAKETFGPVASVIPVQGLDEAIDIIRAGRYRLAAAIATCDRANADRLQEEIAVGQFSWNGPPGYRTEDAPFGGFGESGNGVKEGIIMSTRAFRRVRTFYQHTFGN